MLVQQSNITRHLYLVSDPNVIFSPFRTISSINQKTSGKGKFFSIFVDQSWFDAGIMFNAGLKTRQKASEAVKLDYLINRFTKYQKNCNMPILISLTSFTPIQKQHRYSHLAFKTSFHNITQQT